jgi:hypothetical protein
VQISAKNGSAADVTVKLTGQPSAVAPRFSSGCAKGDGTASCAVASVTDKQAVTLKAGIAVATTATYSSVKLTATATVTTTATWTPPTAAETTAVKAASASASAAAPANGPADGSSLAVLPLGPIPTLNGAASVLIGAGNAARLFPAITPSPGSGTGSPAGTQPGQRGTTPLSGVSAVSDSSPAFTAQVAGLIVLGLAIMLTVTRLAVRRRRSRPSGPRG